MSQKNKQNISLGGEAHPVSCCFKLVTNPVPSIVSTEVWIREPQIKITISNFVGLIFILALNAALFKLSLPQKT